MGPLKIVLYPFSIIYGLVTRFRNHLYDIGYKKSFQFEVVTINVGNLSVGGTGKTPMIEYLVRRLRQEWNVATLSRGYGRTTKNFRLASTGDTAATLGDEPYQFYLKFGQDIKVAVGEERVLAIPKIMFEAPETEVILLDDAFQHRTVVPGINIMLTDFNRPFYEDHVLPAGRLREGRQGAKRAGAIIVTKCPGWLDDRLKESIKKEIKRYAKPDVPVFFTSVQYAAAKPILTKQQPSPDKEVILLTGIAHSGPLKQYVEKNYHLLDHIQFNDHYAYKTGDINRIKRALRQTGEKTSVLTTEKDMARLIHPDLRSLLEPLPIFYIPITVDFLEGKEAFDTLVVNCIQKGQNFA